MLRKSHWAWCLFERFNNEKRWRALSTLIGHDAIFERFNNWRAIACKWLVIGHDAIFERANSSCGVFQTLPIPEQIIGFVFQSFSPRYLLVNFGAYILQNTLCLAHHSSEILGWKACFLLQFSALRHSFLVLFSGPCLHLAPFCLSIWLPFLFFKGSKNDVFTTKTPLSRVHFAPFSYVFNGSKRFCLYDYSVFSCFSSCIYQHFALRLAAKRIAFSGILACVLHQNALHLAPKRTTFSTKTHSI